MKNPCIIEESSNIIKSFKDKYGNYKNTIEKLIERINWNTRTFTDLSQLEQVDNGISLYLKSNIINLIVKKLQYSFETRGLCSFTEMSSILNQIEIPEVIITKNEYVRIFQEEYINFM